MKITKNSLCFIIQSERYLKQHNEFMNSIPNQTDELKILHKIKQNFINTKFTRTLVLSKNTTKNLKNYKVPKSIRIDVLKSLPNRKDIIQLDENYVINYEKSDTRLNIGFHRVDEKNDLRSFFVDTDLITRETYMDETDYYGSEKPLEFNEMIKKYYTKFMVLVTYLELTDVSLSIVKPNTKRGDLFKGNYIKNSSNLNVIQVNTNWNTLKFVVGVFNVRTHMRLQRVGKGLCEFRWVLINGYKKNLVIRSPQKQLQC